MFPQVHSLCKYLCFLSPLVFGSSHKCWVEKMRMVEHSFAYVHCTFGTPLFSLYYQEKFPRPLFCQAKSDNLVPICLQRHLEFITEIRQRKERLQRQ